MDIRISDGDVLEFTGKSDDVTVTNLGSQKPLMSRPPSISSSSVSSTSESMIDSLKEEEEFDWVAVERETDIDVAITDKAPEIDEVEDALSALQLMFNEDESEDQGSEELDFEDWIEPPLHLCNTRLVQPYMLDRLYDSFHLFQTEPAIQRVVMSLASDRAVWDAVMNNEVVRELITNGQRSGDESGSAATFIRRLFKRSASKIIDAMERVTKYVTDLFNVVVVPGDETVVLATGPAPVMEKLQTTVLLAVVVLLIVLVTRVTRAR